MLDELLKETYKQLDITFIEVMKVMDGKGITMSAALGRAIAAMLHMHGGTDESLEMLFTGIRKDLEMFRNKKDEKEC